MSESTVKLPPTDVERMKEQEYNLDLLCDAARRRIEMVLGSLTAREWAFMRTLLADTSDREPAAIFADYLADHGKDKDGNAVRLLRCQTGDAMIAHLGEEIWESEKTYRRVVERLEALRQDLEADDRKVYLVLLRPGNDLENLSADEMARLGWMQRVEAHRLLNEEASRLAGEAVQRERDAICAVLAGWGLRSGNRRTIELLAQVENLILCRADTATAEDMDRTVTRRLTESDAEARERASMQQEQTPTQL